MNPLLYCNKLGFPHHESLGLLQITPNMHLGRQTTSDIVWKIQTNISPLTLRRTNVYPFTEISILFYKTIIKKVDKRKEPILGYEPKTTKEIIWSIKG